MQWHDLSLPAAGKVRAHSLSWHSLAREQICVELCARRTDGLHRGVSLQGRVMKMICNYHLLKKHLCYKCTLVDWCQTVISYCIFQPSVATAYENVGFVLHQQSARTRSTFQGLYITLIVTKTHCLSNLYYKYQASWKRLVGPTQ